MDGTKSIVPFCWKVAEVGWTLPASDGHLTKKLSLSILI